jgi:hypothetical protein
MGLLTWFTTKGEEQGEEFWLNEVPYEIAVDIHDKKSCCPCCENVFTSRLPWGYNLIEMRLFNAKT